MLKTLFVLFCGLALWACQPTSDPFETKGEDNVIQWNPALLPSSSSTPNISANGESTVDGRTVYEISKCQGQLPDSVPMFDMIVTRQNITMICTQAHCRIDNPRCSNFDQTYLNKTWILSPTAPNNLSTAILKTVDYSLKGPWQIKAHSLDSANAGLVLILQTDWILSRRIGQASLSLAAGTYLLTPKSEMPESLSINGLDPNRTHLILNSKSTQLINTNDTLKFGRSAQLSNLSISIKNQNIVKLLGNNSLVNTKIQINNPKFIFSPRSKFSFENVDLISQVGSANITWFTIGKYSRLDAKNIRWQGLNSMDTLLRLDSSTAHFENAEMLGTNWKSAGIIHPGDTLFWHKGQIQASLLLPQNTTRNLFSSTEGTPGTRIYNSISQSGFLDLAELGYNGFWIGDRYTDGTYQIQQSSETISGKTYAVTTHFYQFGSLACSNVWGQGPTGSDTLFCGTQP